MTYISVVQYITYVVKKTKYQLNALPFLLHARAIAVEAI
jgi:hypothetical protein